MAWKYYLPLILVIGSNILYHNTAKNTPTNVNAFLSLMVAYSISAAITALLYFGSGANLVRDIHNINWTSWVLGVSIVGVEIGYILMYRFGWELSKGALASSVYVALALLVIGALYYREMISLKQIMGMLCCLAGIFMVSSK